MRDAASYCRGLRAAIVILLGEKCRNRACPIHDPRLLQIDHVNNGGGAHRREHRNNRKYLASILRDLRTGHRKYQLLCANHHVLKTMCRHKRPHGGAKKP